MGSDQDQWPTDVVQHDQGTSAEGQREPIRDHRRKQECEDDRHRVFGETRAAP